MLEMDRNYLRCYFNPEHRTQAFVLPGRISDAKSTSKRAIPSKPNPLDHIPRRLDLSTPQSARRKRRNLAGPSSTSSSSINICSPRNISNDNFTVIPMDIQKRELPPASKIPLLNRNTNIACQSTTCAPAVKQTVQHVSLELLSKKIREIQSRNASKGASLKEILHQFPGCSQQKIKEGLDALQADFEFYIDNGQYFTM